MTNDEIEKRDYGLIINRYVVKWWRKLKKERREAAATLKIQTFYRMRFIKNSSFINALKLAEYPKIYFLKEQKPQFMKILKKLVSHFKHENMTLEDAFNCIKEDSRFDTIRVEEPDLFQFRPLPLLQFIMPTFGKKTLIRENSNIGLDKTAQPNMSLNDFYFMRNPE